MTGVNVIGHLSASSGLGNTARLFIRALLQRGVQVAALDIERAGEASDHDLPGVQYVGSIGELPFQLNLVIVSIPLLPSLWLRRMPELLGGRFINVGLVFWELQVLPPAWLPALQVFDAIAVCSQFVRSAIELSLPHIPTVYAEHPLEPQVFEGGDAGQRQAVRDGLGLGPDDVVFASSFDLRSDFARKNPLAVLRAFKAAFEGEPRARLLLKSNGGLTQAQARSAQVFAEIRGDARIVYIEKTLPYLEVMRIYGAADVFVSLHRAEGLGLGPMEAMLLGKPVIGTGYSGNMSFMNEHNSVPVRYSMVRPQGAAWQFGPDFSGDAAYWAEPDIEAAAAVMKKIFDDSAARERIGRVARRDMLERQEVAWAAGFVDQIDALRLRPKSTAELARLSRRIACQEFLNPVLRRKNLEAFWASWRVRLGRDAGSSRVPS